MDPNSAYSRSLINSIPFSQALQLKKHLHELKKSFINRGYKEIFLTDQFNRISDRSNKGSFLTSKPKTANKARFPIVLKYNIILSNIKEIIDKHWYFLQISPKLKRYQ